MKRISDLLRERRGSVAASVIFVLFSGITMTGILALVLATMNASGATRNYSATSSSAAMKASSYLGSIIVGGSDTAEECVGTACATINATTAPAEIRSFTVDAVLGEHSEISQKQTVRKVDANYVAGYDTSGNPIWVTEEGTAPHKFTNVRSHGDFTCAIDDAKQVYCWGDNVRGQLGNGTTSNEYSPTAVTGTTKFASLANGTSLSQCGLDDTGRAWCWGENAYGQLGADPSVTANRYLSVPTAVPGGRVFTSLVQSATTTCGIERTTNLAWCWGENNGDSNANGSFTPVAVAGAHTYSKLVLDRTTACGLTTTARILCWTANGLGQVGHSLGADGQPAAVTAATTHRVGGTFNATTALYTPTNPTITLAGQDKDDPGTNTPVEIPETGPWKDVATSGEERDDAKSVICAIKDEARPDESGAAWCWGDNDYGQLGNGTTIDSDTPKPVSGALKFKTITPSAETVCGISNTARVHCWGANDYGQLGDGSAVLQSTAPVAVDTTTQYRNLHASTGNKKWFCATNTSDDLKCWGRNSFGQMDAEPSASVSTPKHIQGLRIVEEVSLGDHTAIATDSTHAATGWGRNGTGQAGIGMRTTTPTEHIAPTGLAERSIIFSEYTGYVNGGRQ